MMQNEKKAATVGRSPAALRFPEQPSLDGVGWIGVVGWIGEGFASGE